MTKDQIEDYLYFFWAPLLKANSIADVDRDSFERLVILTLSQVSVYIEAPDYVSGASSRDYSADIVTEIDQFADKIVANIPDRTTDDSFWLKIITQSYFFTESIADTQLEPEASFGIYHQEEGNILRRFDFYYLPHQIQLQLPTTAEISAIISAKTPFAIPDGDVTSIDIAECTLWLCAIHFDASANNAALYTGLQLKSCNISFDSGYAKSGDKIAAGLLSFFSGFVITAVPQDRVAVEPAITIASGNTLTYPNKLVFSFKHKAGLPQPPKISLTHVEPFTTTLFGSTITSDAADNVVAKWATDKNLLSFPLTSQDATFSAIENSSPVFNFKGSGKFNNLSWYLQPVSTAHPLGVLRLGLGADDGYVGFDSQDQFTLGWDSLDNGPLKLKDLFIRTSNRAFFLTYTFNANKLASQKLQLWNANDSHKSSSLIDISYSAEGKGNFVSHISTEQNVVNTSLNLNIDRPVLSNGNRIFYQAPGQVIFIRDAENIAAAVLGQKMDPAIAFENNGFKQLSSFALSNALILVNPVDLFFLVGRLNTSGLVIEGQSFIRFPIRSVEHTLPDPYITSLFNDQPDNNDIQPTSSLMVTIQWNDIDGAELDMQLADVNGAVITPKSTLTDEQLADALLQFPLRHPGEAAYDDLFKSALAAAGIAAGVDAETIPYSSYKSFYQSKINVAGAFSALHILPGNISLVDVSGRASQMGIAFSRRLDSAENDIQQVYQNTGYNSVQTYRIENNEVVSSGRFVRAFTLPQVGWEPIYFEEQNDTGDIFNRDIPFPTHGVPTRIASANRADVALAPIPITKYIVDGFQDEDNQYAAAAHFALPFGMNAIALFHPFVPDVKLPPLNNFKVLQRQIPEPYSYSILNFNQPDFNLKKAQLSGALQIKVLSEGLPDIPRDANRLPDPSFHGAVLQMPNSFSKVQIQNGVLAYEADSILGIPVTAQFNLVMYGKYVLQNGIVPPVIQFTRSLTAKVPLRRIDFSGFGTSVFSNWLDKYADAGAVSQVKFNILIGRVAHEVVQIKSSIMPFFVPVVRTIIIERKNHGNIIRTDSGWVPTGPGVYHVGYDCHPGVVKGVYNVSSIKDTEIELQQHLINGDDVKMVGVYYDADVLLENVSSGFKVTAAFADSTDRLVPSKKQFGYIILGNNAGKKLDQYYTKQDLQAFMTRPDVGVLGGPVDCVVNIAGTDQLMHVTRADVTATTSTLLVAAARGTLQLPKGGSWSVVKKVPGGATLPLTNDETVPLIRNGILQFDVAENPTAPNFANSLHVLGNPLEIEKYAAAAPVPASVEYALLQSTGTQKLLFPRPSFDSNNMVAVDGVTRVKPQILATNPVIADPYSLIKSNAIFPDNTDVLTLKNQLTGMLADKLDINLDTAGISFPDDIAAALVDFIPPECIPAGDESRKLYLVKEDAFNIYIDYGLLTLDDGTKAAKQLFTAALDGTDDNKNRWQMGNKEVAIVVELADFKPLLTVKGDFNASPDSKPIFDNARIEWGSDGNLQKIIQVLSILSMLSKEDGTGDIVKEGFSFVMGNSPDSWSYKCTIEEKIPVIKFPSAVQLAQLPGPAPLIVEAGLDLGVFFNLSLSADPNNLVKAGAGIVLGFEATIQVLLITIEVATAYGVGTAKVQVFVELPDAKPTFEFTMGFGATVAVQLPMVGYVSLTRVMSLGVSINNSPSMTVGQMLRGVLTIAGGLASVTLQVEASGTVTDKNAGADPSDWTATVRGVFELDVTVAFVLSWDFSAEFEHEIGLPNPF
ncbi:hypothetical protein [Mucilaginibacter agri]|uniref:Uncharacterized protein n=1 Tax=Mucilaginibacter agri TaxID=2695265 RepID=A0A966DWG3_9SPHI|nr:hypothetical protein [Mucilaginibacter agri]NCD72506.1 hypothetical protein [Mucilaginibacter agri]